ncbi:hypothetical protein lerEdw1_001905 [Lerista edwardsae]|nr:hypothetical protein lerEdw1_001905 [Lerista edwardsae]
MVLLKLCSPSVESGVESGKLFQWIGADPQISINTYFLSLWNRLGESLLPQELIHRFRANIVISTNEPFEEDKWEKIKIGALHFKV